MLDRAALLHLRHIPGQSVTYLQNPKVATKTIESSLWQAYDGQAPINPHGAEGSPFLGPMQLVRRLDQVCATEFFTVARNPYTRFLSAFINKVERRGAWRKLSAQFGFTPDFVPSPAVFLERLAEMSPWEVNHHFRPQHLNVLHGLVPLTFVGHLERMSLVATYLEGHGIGLREEARSRAPTRADSLMTERLDDATLCRLAEVYGRDFSVFGYSEDWRIAEPVASVESSGSLTDLRRALS